jgi:hypothetical protein
VLLPALIFLAVAVILATCAGVAAYAAHVRAPVHGAAGLHRARVGRHRSGGPVSVAGLRAREQAENMRMYPTANQFGRRA